MMKKLHFKKLLLTALMLVGAGTAWAETFTNVSTVSAKFTANGDVTNNFTQTGDFKEVNWNLAVTWSGEAGFGQNIDGTKGAQIGTGSKPATSIVLTGSNISGTIASVVVNTSGANSIVATMGVTVGGTAFKSGDANTVSLTNTATDYTFIGSASGNVVITWNQESSKAIYIKSITITYVGSVVPVEDVEIEPSGVTLDVGETVQMTAIVSPSNATNKEVTWTSEDPEVATVSETGLVTAVAVGRTMIKATSKADEEIWVGSTVEVQKSTPSLTFDFTSNEGWGFPTSKEEGPATFTKDGLSIILQGSSGQGYYYDATGQNLLLGKNGATLTFPAFGFNVKRIKVYGAEGASAGVTENIFVGDEAVSTEATSAKVDHIFDIAAEKQEAGTIYVLKVTNGNNTRISKIEIFGYIPVTIGSTGFATSASDYDMFYGAIGELYSYRATISGNDITFVEDGRVPAGEGVLVQGPAGTYKVPVEKATPWAASYNAFVRGTGEAVASEADGKYNYILNDGANGIGFYKANGKKVAKNHAYLQTTSANARIIMPGEETTGIANVDANVNGNNNYYDLQGRRVAQPTKGMYIVNGKKVIIK